MRSWASVRLKVGFERIQKSVCLRFSEYFVQLSPRTACVPAEFQRAR
jgi:hypothetical protein